MKINNTSNKTNFGMKHVGFTSTKAKFINLVESAKADIMKTGHSESICEIFDQELFPISIGKVAVVVMADGANNSTVAGWAKGVALTKKALLKLVEEANNQLNQRFFDKYYAQITAKPEIDSVTKRPKLEIVK